MSNMSFLEKIKILFDVTSSSSIFIIALLLLTVLGFLFVTTNKKNAKSSKKVYILMYIAVIVFTLITYNESLSNMFDYMMNNFFIAVYFPNLAIYLAAIIITNIITWVSMFNYKTNKTIKYINIVMFCIIHYLLILVLNIITTEKLDVFTQSSVYGNNNALALIELSSTIFIVWIIGLEIYKIIRKYLDRNKNSDTKEVQEKVQTIPSYINKLEPPYVVKKTPTNRVVIEKSKKQDTSLYDNMLTLDDYKLLLNMLKEQKKKEKEEFERKQRETDTQDKFVELQNLYKSVR